MVAGENVFYKDVSDILSDMLETKFRIHNKNDDVTFKNNFVSDDDHVHDDVEVDIIVANDYGVNNNKKKRKYTSRRKKARAVKDVNDNLNDIKVPINKKSNEIITRKKAQLVAQDYAPKKGVDFDEAFIYISHLEAIKMLLGLSYSIMFTLYHMGVKSVFLNRYLNMEVNQDVYNDVT